MVVIDRDPFETEPGELKDISVQTVIFDGNVVRGEL